MLNYPCTSKQLLFQLKRAKCFCNRLLLSHHCCTRCLINRRMLVFFKLLCSLFPVIKPFTKPWIEELFLSRIVRAACWAKCFLCFSIIAKPRICIKPFCLKVSTPVFTSISIFHSEITYRFHLCLQKSNTFQWWRTFHQNIIISLQSADRGLLIMSHWITFHKHRFPTICFHYVCIIPIEDLLMFIFSALTHAFLLIANACPVFLL